MYDSIRAEETEKVRGYRRPAMRFTASSCGGCPWRQWFNLSGYRPAPLAPEARVRMLQGEIDHNVVRNLLRRHGVLVGGVVFKNNPETLGDHVTETMSARQIVSVDMPDKLVDTIELSARIDGLVALDEGEAIFEFKDMGNWGFKHLKEAAETGGEESALRQLASAHQYYLWQMQVSMFLFDKQRAYFAPRNRADAQFGIPFPDGTRRGLVVKRDERLLTDILQFLAQLQRYVKGGTPPPKSTRELKGSGMCNNCEYYHLCHGADERKKKGLEPVVLYPGPQIEEHPDQPISAEASE